MQHATPSSLIDCSCRLKFRVGDMVGLADTHLALPRVVLNNPDGHELNWNDGTASPGFRCGWLTLHHGRRNDASSSGDRHFVRIPYKD